MKERPILFQGAMVRALLAGTKTQTRRAVKGLALSWLGTEGFTPEFVASPENWLCPYGFAGDRLWVRESFLGWYNNADGSFSHVAAFKASGYELEPTERWKPSIFMPRAASRITLEITGVRVERLQDISEEDAAAEGIQEIVDAGVDHDGTPRDAYRALWEQINGAGSWDANPWVWVVEFKRTEPPHA